MKNFAIAIIMTVLSIQNASAAEVKGIKTFKELAAGIHEYDLEHYYIQVHDDLGEIREMLKGASCKFKKQSALTVAKDVREIISEGISRGLDAGIIDQDDGYFSLMESLQQATLELRKSLTGKELAVCDISSVPAYSDGHTLTVVKVSGKIAFAYEVGFPD